MKFIANLLILLGFSTSFKVDEFDIYSMEGFVAYSFNANYASNDNHTPQPKEECKCGGTGKIKMVDGNIAQCPCGPSCSCKKSVPALNKRVLMFTDSKHCAPCKQFKNKTIPVLIKKGANWTFGPEPSNHVQVFDASDNKDPRQFEETFHKYSITSIPTFILIENDKEIGRKEGFMNPKEFTNFFYGK